MSDNLASQDKFAKKTKKMELVAKASASKSSTSQESVKSLERVEKPPVEMGEEERRKERERHNSGASSTNSLPVYPRNSWSNSQRYTKYRGNSEGRRYVSNTSYDGNLRRHTSTQSLNSNAGKKIEEEPGEGGGVTTPTGSSETVANDIRRIAVNSPDSEEGKVTYIAAGTAPAARIGTLRQNANTAAFSAYAGPAPTWDGQRGGGGGGERQMRGGFPPAAATIPTQFKNTRVMEENGRYYEKRDDGRREMRGGGEMNRSMRGRGGYMKRGPSAHQAPMTSAAAAAAAAERVAMGEMEMEQQRETNSLFFKNQNDENCRNTLASISALTQMQQQLAENQGMANQTLPRFYGGEWRNRRADEREGGGRTNGMLQQQQGETSAAAASKGEKKKDGLYPAATAKITMMDGRERRRGGDRGGGGEEMQMMKDSSLPSTPKEADLSFSNALPTPSKERMDEVDGGSTMMMKKGERREMNGVHHEMSTTTTIHSSSFSTISHHHSTSNPQLSSIPAYPSHTGIPTLSMPPPHFSHHHHPTTVSTLTPPPTVSSALPNTMVAQPQRSQESIVRSSSCHHFSAHHNNHAAAAAAAAAGGHNTAAAAAVVVPTAANHHMVYRTVAAAVAAGAAGVGPGGFPPNYSQPPPNVMEQTEEAANRLGGIGIGRKEEGAARGSFNSAHPPPPPTSWNNNNSSSSSATSAAAATVAAAAAAAAAANQAAAAAADNAGASGPPPAPPAGFVDERGRYTLSEMDFLSEEIWHYHNNMTQTESTLSRKLHLRDMLYYAICPVFPMCGLYVVGSSLNGFGNNSSDMDLCLMITNKDLDQKTDAVVVLNMILNQLENVEWVAHQQLILAKVPILRIQFTAPFGDITVDLNANNSVAIKNTHLLCYYSTFDWRVRPLVTIVKEWAKKRGINDANRSSFTSYSLVLMVIHYLQCGLDQPVLPSLQSMFARRFSRTADVRSLNVSIPLPTPTEEWSFNETSTLGELLIGFLEYFAEKFDYNAHAISVRMGKKLDRTVVVRTRGQFNQPTNNWRSQWRCVCIEEPFTYSNTAHSVYDEMVFTSIKESFREAYHELESTRDLRKLLNCTPISVPILPHGNGAVVYMNGCAQADNSVVASSSSSSLSTPHSGHASSASSSCGGDDEVDGGGERVGGVSGVYRDKAVPVPASSSQPIPPPTSSTTNPSRSSTTTKQQPKRPEGSQ